MYKQRLVYGVERGANTMSLSTSNVVSPTSTASKKPRYSSMRRCVGVAANKRTWSDSTCTQRKPRTVVEKRDADDGAAARQTVGHGGVADRVADEQHVVATLGDEARHVGVVCRRVRPSARAAATAPSSERIDLFIE